MAGETPSFSTLDYILFSASLAISLCIGLFNWYKNRGEDIKEFFMGGGRMPVLPVSLSLMVGMISAVSVLGYPAEMFYYGSQLWTSLLGTLAGTGVCLAVVVPVIFPLKCITIFQFLEIRWGSGHVRCFATVLFMILQGTFMGIALYAPSQGISSVTPITTNTAIVTMGVICCIYVSLGGVKAVVYTDTFQSMVMMLGVVIVVVTGLVEVGGVSNSWAINKQYNRIEFFNFNTDPLERHTFMTTFILGINLVFCTVGTSQVEYQRWASVATLSQSYIVIVVGSMCIVGLWSLLCYAGLVVFSVYAECDPLTAGYIKNPDQVLMYFVVDKLVSFPGFPGLFVAAVCCGAMSTVSSVINALCAVMWMDILQPLQVFATASEAKAKNINIIISACTGTLGVVMGLMAGYLGSVLQATRAVAVTLTGPIIGMMFTAILCPWVKRWSVLLGSMFGLVLNMWVAIGQLLYAPPPEMLPLSTAGCPDPILSINTTTVPSATFTTTSTVSINTSADFTENRSEVFPLYRLSYCLTGCIGFVTTIAMSTVFSCFLGFAAPSSVPVVAVNRTCLRFYCWLRGADMPVDIRDEASHHHTRPGEMRTNDGEPVKSGRSLENDSHARLDVLNPLNVQVGLSMCENII